MKVAEYNVFNIGPTPKEIKRQRQQVFDFHRTLGRPVIFKHRWNFQDAQNGLCVPCPYTDQTYHRGKTDCPYCFGTSFLGGFADGVIVFLTLADAPIDQLKISPEGVILFDRHPQMVAPWLPEMGDGDLIITADFDRSTWEVLQTLDVFELNDVEPVNIRGIWGQYTDYKLYRIQQKATVDKIPRNHVYYNVPVEFDYSSVPVVSPPPGAFPSDYRGNIATSSFPFRLIGSEGGITTNTKYTFLATGVGTAASTKSTLKLKGNVGPQQVQVIFE